MESMDMITGEIPEKLVTDKATAIVGLVLVSIYTGNKEDVVKYLEKIPIIQLTPIRQVTLLDVLVGKIYEDNRPEMLDVIFGYVDKIHSSITDLSTLSLFVMRSGIPVEILQYIGNNIQNQTFEMMIQDISDYPISPSTYEGCVNTDKMFGKQDRIVYERLESYLLTDPNDVNRYVYDFVREKLDETESYKEPPEYVSIGDVDGNKLFVQDDIIPPDFPDVKLPSPDNAAKKMKKFLKTLKVDIKERDAALAVFSSQYSISTLEQKLKLLTGIIGEIDVSLINDIKLFRLYGPCNSMSDMEITRGDPDDDSNCHLYGGCRMMICDCVDNVEEEDGEGLYDYYWFTGMCEYCRLKIKHPHYALREPILYGGWSGCFCSLSCISSSMKEKDALSGALLDRMEEQLENIGIAERTYKDRKNERIYVR